MKCRSIYLSVILFFIFNNIQAQQLMQSLEDASKIKDYEQQFVDKALKSLLKEIRPDIKMVTANPSKNANSRLGYFIFRFVDSKTYDSCRLENIYPLQITVFVKEPFSWHIGKNKISYKSSWTKDDLEKYGDLMVAGVRVFGDNYEIVGFNNNGYLISEKYYN